MENKKFIQMLFDSRVSEYNNDDLKYKYLIDDEKDYCLKNGMSELEYYEIFIGEENANYKKYNQIMNKYKLKKSNIPELNYLHKFFKLMKASEYQIMTEKLFKQEKKKAFKLYQRYYKVIKLKFDKNELLEATVRLLYSPSRIERLLNENDDDENDILDAINY
jgi:hypothetical protein